MKLYEYTDISLEEFPGETSLVLYNQRCDNFCPFCFKKKLIGGQNLTWKQIKDAIDEHIDFITGVVFSGGEPLLIQQLFKAVRYCKDRGLKVKINTSGIPNNHHPNIWYHIDYINYSLKPGIGYIYQPKKTTPLRSGNFIKFSSILEYSFVYSPTILPEKKIKDFSKKMNERILSDKNKLFPNWYQPEIFTISQIQTGNCLNSTYNNCKVPNEDECIQIAQLFKNIPIKKLVVETREHGRKILKK